MPLYEYECKQCHERLEKIQSFSAPHETKCPKCGGELERVISAPAIQFKGAGWYVNDYAKSGSKPANRPIRPASLTARRTFPRLHPTESQTRAVASLRHRVRILLHPPPTPRRPVRRQAIRAPANQAQEARAARSRRSNFSTRFGSRGGRVSDSSSAENPPWNNALR